MIDVVMDFLRDHFARLEWAWALLAIPAAIGAYAWGRRQRKQAMAALGHPELVQRLISTVNPGARLVRAIAASLALAGVAFALMRPQHGGVAKVVPSQGLDIVVAVDYSKSMLVDDVYPTRIERLEAELGHFLDDARERGDRVGVVVFAGAARGLPVTSDTRLLRMYLEAADPRTENPGGTAIGKALRLSLDFLLEARRLNRGESLVGEGETGEGGEEPASEDEETLVAPEEADQVIILLTDGEDNASRPMEIAEEAAKVGVRIYTVGIGSKSGQPVMKFNEQGEPDGWVRDGDGKVVMTRLDEATLEALSKKTAGDYVHVSPDSFGLDEIRLKMKDLAAAEREDSVEIEREESFAFVVLPSLFLLCVALGLGDRRRRKEDNLVVGAGSGGRA